MKLDDNTRAALHYLGLATVVILVLLGIAWGLSAASTSGAPSLIPFKHGYLLLPADTVVVAIDPLGMRLAKGFLLACAGAILLGLLGALITWLLGSPSRSWVSRFGTWSFAVLLGWSMITACFVPHRSANPDQEAVAWRITERSVLFGDLALPFTASMREFPFAEIKGIWQGPQYDRDRSCERVDLIFLDLGGTNGTETLTIIEPHPDNCWSKDRQALLEQAVRYLRLKTGLSDDQE